ncbi:MAG: hypothetical protein F6K45_26190 [Kamptonema sp. SIO1D9]|nr:hypothetical protein [Kamptonema sp. SIO1D9]
MRYYQEFNNSPESWSEIFNQSFTATEQSPTGGVRYPEILTSLLLTRETFLVYAVSNGAKPHWKFAGYLNQKIRTGLLVGGQPDAFFKRRSFWLNQLTLIQFDLDLFPEYALSFSVPYWLPDIQIIVWEFRGADRNRIMDELEVVRFDVKQVENKVDGLYL